MKSNRSSKFSRQQDARTGSKNYIGHHISYWSTKNYQYRLSGFYVDSIFFYQEISQSLVYHFVFHPIPLSFSSRPSLREREGENVDFIWHKSSLSPRRILRLRSFTSDPLPCAREFCIRKPSRRDFNALRDIPTPILLISPRHIVFFFFLRVSSASKKFCSRANDKQKDTINHHSMPFN